MADTLKSIKLRGIRQNNLKGFDLDLPLGHLIVVTGLSGAGKSSLVFETVHAEGQRRYVETFSPYTRQFLEILDRPRVDSVENIHPSIAIEQRNTVKTSRSTVGTMTELTDFFKIWFSHVASLFDPDTGKKVEDDSPQSIRRRAFHEFEGQSVLVCFAIHRPGNLTWGEIKASIQSQGYTRILPGEGSGPVRIETWDPPSSGREDEKIFVIQDRVKLEKSNRTRFVEAVETALHFGQGRIELFSSEGVHLRSFSEGLHSPESNRTFQPASPALFSFNSPVGACSSCRGFGRIIEIDYNLVIPDHGLSLEEGAIRPFQGNVYSESLRDLIRVCRIRGIDTSIPWRKLPERDREFIIEGDPDYDESKGEGQWYGIKRFFRYLENNTYKMHVRVFLSRYRAYVPCPTCGGTRLQPESLNWKWKGFRLPDLYRLPINELAEKIRSAAGKSRTRAHGKTAQADLSCEAISTRLAYLEEVGLGYLTLDRSSRSLSGGETMRVSLTSCLGTSLVDTLFVLDEPSIGLHSRDINRLIQILQRLTKLGNTVIVVEHDESIMNAANTILEIGPKPGNEGGQLVFQGKIAQLKKRKGSITGEYLSGSRRIDIPAVRRPSEMGGALPDASRPAFIHFRGASKHNLENLDISLPLQRLVALSGVSGSGKSTLLNNVIYQGVLNERGKSTRDSASIRDMEIERGFQEIVMVDQSPVSRTPRSNPALFCDAWDPIRELFASTDSARSRGFTGGSFSFNAGDGRCNHCQGLGYEKIEMQFLSDVFVTCPVCEGRRFKDEILSINWSGHTIADVLEMNVTEALKVFSGHRKINLRFRSLEEVGLGYLTLGQPLNTLSGGESQRLKLVKYLSRFDSDTQKALLLLDEPTTGLHREDVRRLIGLLQKLVDKGNGVIVIEHQLDVLAAADWIIEMGPGAGLDGGKIVAEGPPESIAESPAESAPFLSRHLGNGSEHAPREVHETPDQSYSPKKSARNGNSLRIRGAREHNLKNLDIEIPHGRLSVITGVSGSGKSSLAFDIVFAEGQRRFMESMSAYARQFVEQLPRPDIDSLTGIAPTVAIEQRVTRGSRKSTVATITEVAQYLRLLYARIGIQHHPETGKAVHPLSADQLKQRFHEYLQDPAIRKEKNTMLFAPLVRNRKGHHQPLADWARNHGFRYLRCDGDLVDLEHFRKLDRYREHDIELLIADYGKNPRVAREGVSRVDPPGQALEEALRLGRGSCFATAGNHITWFSTTRTDPETGDAFPEPDPKHFSWNSAQGWCLTCRGHGRIFDWLKDHEDAPEHLHDLEHGSLCPDCGGARLNPVSRSVYLYFNGGRKLSLPEFLTLTPDAILKKLNQLKLDSRSRAILADIQPRIEERLSFMKQVGIEYLALNRSTSTLSGGEAQRIRLAAQLGSNLSGVLYVLDEPSIGLHARDNQRLIESLQKLKQKGNTLLVVEHDDNTLRQADRIFDIGPGAGIHGGRIIAGGSPRSFLKSKKSLTAQFLREGLTHPSRGAYRKLPRRWLPRGRALKNPEWLVLSDASLRNLRGDTLHIPITRLVMVCGVSGAGKSTLVRSLLKPAVEGAIQSKADKISGERLIRKGCFSEESSVSEVTTPPLSSLYHGNVFKKVIEVDQSPIGKTPRSTPATYIGAYDIIRDLFSSLPEAKMRGMTPGTFSFNTKGGRCEKCKGAGKIKLEMAFLPNTYVPCDACEGSRYGPELNDITWKNKNIAQILEMTFEEASRFFDFHNRLGSMLALMTETGLGYLKLGQSSPTLSGGEAQRLKLVSELVRGLQSQTERSRGILPHNLYILEEPTIGLHLSDCRKLIHLLHRLVDMGHTVIVIEHHLDLLAEADYLVELGPGGGKRGGRILYQGEARGILKRKSSPTAPFLASKISVSGKG